MRVGIIGSGGIAQSHGPLILKQPDAEIVGIADKDVSRAKALAAQLNVSQIYEDAQVMVEEQKPDVVHVLVPPQYHAELSIMAMNHGCHVLVEKPMALTTADAERMIEVAKQNKVYLCVDHNFVFEGVVQRAMELVATGSIGQVVSVEVCQAYDAGRNAALVEEGAEYSHWSYRMNGGPLQDLMPHAASLVIEFIPEIEEIQCLGINRGVLPKGWQDEIRVLVKSGGVTGYISLSLSQRPDVASLAVKGTRGTVDADLFSGVLTVRSKSGLPRGVTRGLSGFQMASQYLRGSLGNVYRFATGSIDKSEGRAKVIAGFYESILNGSELPVSMDKGLRVVDLMSRVWPEPVADSKIATANGPPAKKNHRAATALVTGASGFIGTHLVRRLLSEDISVRALVRPNSIHAGRLKKVGVDIVEGDLSNAEVLHEAARGVKTIYHVGAATNNNWNDHHQSTIKGTEYLIDAALANRVERLVHVSTLGVYELDGVKKNARIGEDSPYQKNPQLMGPNAYSKLESEKLALGAFRDHGLGVTIVRPGIVVGPLGRIFFPHLGYRYQDRLFLMLGKGDAVLPLTYVENTVDGIYKASTQVGAVGQSYNLVDDGEITVRDYIGRFVTALGTGSRVAAVPYLVPYLATAAYEVAASLHLLKSGLTSRRQLGWKHKHVYFDNAKAKRELGWTTRIPIEEGLATTFEWFASRNGYR